MNNPKISDMLRITTENSTKLYIQIAEHIDALEEEILSLKQRIAELESKTHD